MSGLPWAGRRDPQDPLQPSRDTLWTTFPHKPLIHCHLYHSCWALSLSDGHPWRGWRPPEEMLEEGSGSARRQRYITESRGGLQAQGQGSLGPDEPEGRDVPTEQSPRESSREPGTSESPDGSSFQNHPFCPEWKTHIYNLNSGPSAPEGGTLAWTPVRQRAGRAPAGLWVVKASGLMIFPSFNFF